MSETVKRVRGWGGLRRRRNRRAIAGVVIATMMTVLSAVSGASASAPDKVISDFLAADVLDLAPDDVYLAGGLTTGSVLTWELRHWDGHTWSSVAGAAECCYLIGLSALSDHDIWAVGWGSNKTIVLHGQPGDWGTTVLPGSYWDNPQSIVALSDSDVWVFAYIAYGLEYETPVTWHFDGTSWTRVDPPITGDGILGNATASGPHSMWVTGYQYSTGGNVIAHWNGHTWKVRTQVRSVDGIGAVGKRDVWAVAGNGAGGQGPFTTHWDGTGWTDGRGAPTPGTPWLSDVAGSSATNVWAVGYDTRSVHDVRLLIEHWDGETWAKVRPAHPNEAEVEELTDVSTSGPNDSWAVGYSRAPDGGVVERWDGSRWRSVDPTS